MTDKLHILKIVGRVLLCVGAFLVVLSAIFGAKRFMFIRHSQVAEGTVVRLQERTDQETGDLLYAPVFSFLSADGQQRLVIAGTASNPPEFQVGESVRILYPRDAPNGAVINSFWQLWFVTFVLGVIGAGWIIVGAVVMFFYRRARRRRDLAHV